MIREGTRLAIGLSLGLLLAFAGCGDGEADGWKGDYDAFVKHLATRMSDLGESPAMQQINSEFRGAKVRWTLVLERTRPDGDELQVVFRDAVRDATPPCRIRPEFYADAAARETWQKAAAGEAVTFTGTVDTVLVATLTSRETGESRPAASVIVTDVRPAE